MDQCMNIQYATRIVTLWKPIFKFIPFFCVFWGYEKETFLYQTLANFLYPFTEYVCMHTNILVVAFIAKYTTLSHFHVWLKWIIHYYSRSR